MLGRYSGNIKQMAAVLRDEPVKPIERAVWHIEHVLKFPGARHFRYHGKDISALEYYATAAFILASGAGAVLLLLCLLRWTLLSLMKILREFRWPGNAESDEKDKRQ